MSSDSDVLRRGAAVPCASLLSHCVANASASKSASPVNNFPSSGDRFRGCRIKSNQPEPGFWGVRSSKSLLPRINGVGFFLDTHPVNALKAQHTHWSDKLTIPFFGRGNDEFTQEVVCPFGFALGASYCCAPCLSSGRESCRRRLNNRRGVRQQG